MTVALENLRQAATLDRFLILAQKALALSDPDALANCAEMVAEREPGGWYYRAKFWAKASEQIFVRANGNGNIAIKQLLNRHNMSAADLRRWEARNALLTQVESEVSAEEIKKLKRLESGVFEIAVKQGRKKEAYIKHALELRLANGACTPRQIHNDWCREHGNRRDNADIVKPSDWWAFGNPHWQVDRGALPGEIYANALYYYAPASGVVADVMAGSGMLKKVYDDRRKWQGGMEFDLKIKMYDLYPQSKRIKLHDARRPLPAKADWIFMDPPYFKQGAKLYKGLIAQTEDYGKYIAETGKVVAAMAESLTPRGKLCVFAPKHRVVGADNPNLNTAEDLANCARAAGLVWYDTAYVSRGRQQLADAARRNIEAKRARRPMSDVCVLNVFEKQ